MLIFLGNCNILSTALFTQALTAGLKQYSYINGPSYRHYDLSRKVHEYFMLPDSANTEWFHTELLSYIFVTEELGEKLLAGDTTQAQL